MAVFLSQLERDWISKHTTGVTPQTPLNTLKKKYYSEYTASMQNYGLPGYDWLRLQIVAAGGTPSGRGLALWQQLNAAKGFPVAKTINANKIIFYTNAP